MAVPVWVLSVVALAATSGSVLAWVGLAIGSLPVLALLEARGLDEAGRPEDLVDAGVAVAARDDELVEDGDPYGCAACLAEGEPCVRHRAWAAGWDACAAFMAAVVNGGAPDDD